MTSETCDRKYPKIHNGTLCVWMVHTGAHSHRLNVIWIKAMRRSKLSGKFVICIRNEECDDLEPRKLYRVLPDEAAAADGYIRVIDESGEDYLYPRDYFLPIELPKAAEKALL